MVPPVKVSVDKDTHLAHTLDISVAARLEAPRTQVQPGTIVVPNVPRSDRDAAFFEEGSRFGLSMGEGCSFHGASSA